MAREREETSMRAVIIGAASVIATPAFADPCDDLAAELCTGGKPTDACVAFVDREMKGADGKALAGPARRAACEAALDDGPKKTAWRKKMRRQAGEHLYRVTVIAQGRQSDGATWDPDGGAPDIDLCIVDGGQRSCVAPPGDPFCRDNQHCVIEVSTAAKGEVRLEVFDVDEDDTRDVIGVCSVTPGKGKVTALCVGELVSVVVERLD